MLDKYYNLEFLEFEPLDSNIENFKKLGIKISKDNGKYYVNLNQIHNFILSLLKNVSDESNDNINEIRQVYQESKDWLDRNKIKIEEQDKLISEINNKIIDRSNNFLKQLKEKEDKINNNIKELEIKKDDFDKRIEKINSEDFSKKLNDNINNVVKKVLEQLIKKWDKQVEDYINELDTKHSIVKEVIQTDNKLEKEEPEAIINTEKEIINHEKEEEEKENFNKLKDSMLEF